MIKLDDLISYWLDRRQEHPPVTAFRWDEVLQSTTAYLIAFKQVHEMLKRLADTVQGIDLEGDQK